MILTARTLREVEHEDRRVLGAFRLVDHVSGTPIATTSSIQAIDAAIIDVAPPGPPAIVSQVPLGPRAVDIRQNRRGWYVVFRAPLFDTYTRQFDQPSNPAELQLTQRLRLRLALTDVGPNHLPRFFFFTLPRSLVPDAEGNVFTPHVVELFRAPAASVLDGWAVLRVSAQQEGTQAALGGVLIRVFPRPRDPADPPLGVGMTEWRDERTHGEAIVPIPGLQRFLPGAGASVFETTHGIEIEATRDTNFPNPADNLANKEELPDVEALISGAGDTIIRRSPPPANPALTIIRLSGPLSIAAGEERSVTLELP